uniref:Thioredoxin domain-containing protein n=1 Tax=Rhabditophanes sp. KR3021 TaxID=114890 RepID=A0AC35UIS0_9BILA
MSFNRFALSVFTNVRLSNVASSQSRNASSIKDLVTIEKLFKPNEVTVNTTEALKDKVTAIYFTAGWCPSCRPFTNKLKRFYDKINKEKHQLEVIFVSLDKTPEDMLEYYDEKMSKWLIMPYNMDHVKALRQECGVSTIPALKVVKSDGTIVIDNARTEVDEKGSDAEALFAEWKKLTN